MKLSTVIDRMESLKKSIKQSADFAWKWFTPTTWLAKPRHASWTWWKVSK